MEFFLFVLCGFAWAIYVLLKKVLAELKHVNARADVTNGLLSSITDRSDAVQTIEAVAVAFHDRLTQSQHRN